MHVKKIIAIFLLTVFLGELVTVDTDILNFIADANQVVLINFSCKNKKKDFQESGENFKTASPVQILKFARTCSNNYQLSVEKENSKIFTLDYRLFVYRKQLIASIDPRKLYPPPQYSLAT
ncbi:hypothetical protein [Christiangramia forsetii]|nr:hypothetical protein [Christiangramia forsetii]